MLIIIFSLLQTVSRCYSNVNIQAEPEAELVRNNNKMSGKVYCKIENCDLEVMVYLRDGMYWSNSNFMSHLQRCHGLKSQKKSL